MEKKIKLEKFNHIQENLFSKQYLVSKHCAVKMCGGHFMILHNADIVCEDLLKKN